MMPNKLLVILSRLLHSQTQNNRLLQPVRCLEEVVEFEDAFARLVWEAFIHCPCIEIPHRGPTHHIQAPRSSECKIYRSIHLFHKTRLLCPSIQSVIPCHRPKEFLHDELASKGQHNRVERYKCKIPSALPILGWDIDRRAYPVLNFVGEKYEFMYRICRGWIDRI